MKVLKEGKRLYPGQDTETVSIVSNMLVELERDKMDAVRKYSQQFDSWNPKSFEAGPAELAVATESLEAQVKRDTLFCQGNVRAFAQRQLETLLPLETEIRPGVILGHRHIPVHAVGSYVPGGRYPMFGSAQMSIIPAKVAGVEQVVACTPPLKEGGCYPVSLYAMQEAGADRIFVLGGVPALALMAFGLEDVEPADILCGAGNKYVAEAKRQLFGRCGIDLLAGPTEIQVLADDQADPALVACDLLGQAEHDPHSGVCLVCLSESFAARVLTELEIQLAKLPTREVAGVAWRDNGIIQVAEHLDEAIELCNRYAPEHLEVHVEDLDKAVRGLSNYGSLFIGEETTVAYGDKTIGTNHILPTGGAARYTGGVWVGKFLKTCTFQRMTEAASVECAAVTERQCHLENMPAHAFTARARLERYPGKEATHVQA